MTDTKLKVTVRLAAQRHERRLDSAASEPAAMPADAANRDPFGALYAAHFPFVWRSLRLLGTPLDALEDAAQEVFATVARRLPEFRGDSSLRTWIFAITQRTASTQRRRHRRKQRPLVPLDGPTVSQGASPEEATVAAEAAALVERFCNHLEYPQRMVFILVLLEGVPVSEVASHLQAPINTIYSRVRLLRQDLHRFLNSENDHGPA